MTNINKLPGLNLVVDVTFMYTGALIEISFTKDEKQYTYKIQSNRKCIVMSRFANNKHDVLVSPDLVLNPLEITEDEFNVIAILPGLNGFEINIFKMGYMVTRMWHNDAHEDYALDYAIATVKDLMGIDK